jgi:FdhD protein
LAEEYHSPGFEQNCKWYGDWTMPLRPHEIAPASESVVDLPVVKYRDGTGELTSDTLAVEDPLEIQVRVAGAGDYQSVCMTMRTPGHDAELAAGFLFNEAVIRNHGDIVRIGPWGPFTGEARTRNICRVDLKVAALDLDRLQRHFFTSSSCGVCGRASLDALKSCAAAPLPVDGPVVPASLVTEFPERLRSRQSAFQCTGGLHATALFDAGGEVQVVHEDVGRHNAMDKVAGSLLREGRLPASRSLLFVSGRLSYELVQKALMMGVPVLAGVGAPSSLAAQLADRGGLTLIGFVRDRRFNVYAHPWRISPDS